MYVDKTVGERNKRYRDRVKKENSTRGNSGIMPVKYKKDIPVQVWMESRYLATLSEWLDKDQDIYSRTRTLSAVVQEGIRVLVDHLVRCNEVDMVDDPLAAQEMLVIKYRISIRKGYGARGSNNLVHNQVLTERRREVAGVVENTEPLRDIRERSVNEVSLGRIRMTPEEKRENEIMVAEFERQKQADLDKEIERQKAAAMKSGRVVVVEHEGETTTERNERLARENSRRIEEDDMMPPGFENE